ncbi:MAG: DUF1189 domain-containing protein [Planctomycetes bacterium]|nr:DUF1189 domain-containing protein [Planctomycetota bacterium]
MKKFSIIHLPVLSFFSKDLYRDVGLHWNRICFGYLLLLLAICWIPMMVRINTGFAEFVKNEAPRVVDQVPEITITDGQVSIKEPQPYFIREPDSNEIIAVIDITGSIKSPADANAFFLLTDNSMIIRQTDFKTQTIDLSQVKSFTMDSATITSWMHTAKKFLVIILYPLALLSSYVYRIIQALIFAAVGLLFASLCKVSLSYGALLRLAVVAMTPCMIVKTVFGLAGVHLPCGVGLVYLLVALAYLYFGVYACSQTPPTEQVLQFPEQTQI